MSVFRPKDDANKIRILPQTWKMGEAEHFSYKVWMHAGIGPDNGQYLSLHKMKDEDDPIRDERARAVRDGDEDYARKLEPRDRQVVWLIDRNADDPQPQLWILPFNVDKELAVRQIDEDGQVIAIDDPYDGYDVTFRKQGKGLKTRYIGIDVSRRPSPISDDDDEVDEILAHISENPVPDCLLFRTYEYINKQFGGKGKDKDVDRDDDDSDDDSTEYTWDELHDMDWDELTDILEDNDLDLDPDDYEDESEFADEIADELGVEKPRRKKSRRSKARSMRR